MRGGNSIELPHKDTEVPIEFLSSWNSAKPLFLKKYRRVGWGMKPNVLRYFCMRVVGMPDIRSVFWLEGTIATTTNIHTLTLLTTPFFKEVSVHARDSLHICTFLMQHTSYTSVGLGITTMCASISKQWKHSPVTVAGSTFHEQHHQKPLQRQNKHSSLLIAVDCFEGNAWDG